jgi:hypothetical protein
MQPLPTTASEVSASVRAEVKPHKGLGTIRSMKAAMNPPMRDR